MMDQLPSILSTGIISPLVERTSPALEWPLTMCYFLSGFTYFVSVVSKNAGIVDRLWALLPLLYTVYFALLPLWPTNKILSIFPHTPLALEEHVRTTYSPRAILMLLLVAVWSIRLHYNGWRRGVWKPNEEDYRWKVLREGMGRFAYEIFSIVWTAFLQNVLLFSLALPVYKVALATHSDLTTADYILAALALFDCAYEFTADNQQWAFQNFKSLYFQRQKSGADPKFSPPERDLPASAHWPFAFRQYTYADAKRGFVTKGLWAWSRHPNFLGEQTFWLLIATFPALSLPLPSASNFVNESLPFLWLYLPALSQVLMFASSTILTENISLSKYPSYAVYQKRVGMLLPLPWGWLYNEAERKKMDRILWGEGKEE